MNNQANAGEKLFGRLVFETFSSNLCSLSWTQILQKKPKTTKDLQNIHTVFYSTVGSLIQIKLALEIFKKSHVMREHLDPNMLHFLIHSSDLHTSKEADTTKTSKVSWYKD